MIKLFEKILSNSEDVNYYQFDYFEERIYKSAPLGGGAYLVDFKIKLEPIKERITIYYSPDSNFLNEDKEEALDSILKGIFKSILYLEKNKNIFGFKITISNINNHPVDFRSYFYYSNAFLFMIKKIGVIINQDINNEVIDDYLRGII